MTTYDPQVATALRLIAAKGGPSTVRKTIIWSKNPVTGEEIKTIEDTPVNAVWLGYDDRAIDGTLIRHGDARVLIAAAQVQEIKKGGHTLLNADDEEWSIINVETINPNGSEPIMHKVQVRR